MRVRRATAADRSEIVRMQAALWPDADPAELAVELDELVAGEDRAVFVAEREDARLGGFAEAGVRPFANGVDEQPCAFLEGWWVDADLRRQGVGRALVAAVEDWARSRGFRELGSDALLENALSHQAHAALGFEERERVVYFRKRL
jgi:aminoglycoside 6'-N-acetyltransferase I